VEWGPLSLVVQLRSYLEEIVVAPVYREYGRGDPVPPSDTLYPQKLVLTSPASGGRSVGIVLSQTKATEFFSIASIF
jgi:hypothetical protein